MVTDHETLQIASAPEGSQAMTLDIAKFHRRTPICAAHKRWFVMQARAGDFYIQHCCPFGARASESNSGEIANAAVDIWQELGVGPTCKWCDDMVIFRYPLLPLTPTPSFAYDRTDALLRISSLGIPWHPDKGQDFGTTFTYVGMLWDLTNRTVALPEPKRKKFLARVHSFLARRCSSQCSLEDAMKIQGSLCHISFVYPLGRSRLPSLSAFVSSFGDCRFSQRYPPRSLLTDLTWWQQQLEIPGVTRTLTSRGPPLELGISVDASTDWGIGVIWRDDWIAWRTTAGWRGPGRDIGWLEGLAVELVAYLLEASGLTDSHIRVHSDNQGIIGAFDKGRSRNFEVNLSIRRTGSCLLACNNSIDLIYVKSGENPADPISRGMLGPPERRLSLAIKLPEELKPFLRHV